MNTKVLAKHYATLTPSERLSLILAASARGDTVEADRLAREAPRVCLRVQDHFGVAMAFREVSEYQLLTLLDLAGWFFQALAAGDEHGDRHDRRLFDVARCLGYTFNVQLDGWRYFCRGENLDPEIAWSVLPGYAMVQRAEGMARDLAFDAGEMAAYGERKGLAKDRLVTVEAVAEDLRKAYRARAEWWG